MTTHDRLPPIPPGDWTAEQAQFAQEIINGPRKALIAPFVPLLRSPELMAHAQRMGEYLRYRSAVGQKLSELAILIVAREWSQQVEWAIHAPIAQSVGISADLVNAIAHGHMPDRLNDDEAVVYAFCTELVKSKTVTDATWDRATARFGERGVVDLIGITGYYTLLSMVMNAARTPAPASSATPLADVSEQLSEG